MRILFFADWFKPEPSAPAANIHERCRLWVRWGHDVTVICAAPNAPEGKLYPGYKNRWRFVENMDGIRVVRVKTFIWPNEGFVPRILDFLSYCCSAFFFSWFERKPDVVISSSGHMFVPVAGVAYSMLRRVPHVFEIRDLWPAQIVASGSMKKGKAYRILEWLELFMYRHSTRVLAFTQAFLEDIVARGVPAEKVDVVVNGANLELFSPQPVKDPEILRQYGLEGRFVIGYLGTLGLCHGLANVIDAAELLKDAPVTFFFVGAGADKELLEQKTRERGLTNVVFAPRQFKEDVPKFWSVCDAALIHLKNDPVFTTVIPSKIFESMAVGMPILYVGPTGQGSAIVDAHQAGVTIPAADPQALADAARALAAEPERRAALAANSLAAAPLYSRERQAENTLKVLQHAWSDWHGKTFEAGPAAAAPEEPCE